MHEQFSLHLTYRAMGYSLTQFTKIDFPVPGLKIEGVRRDSFTQQILSIEHYEFIILSIVPRRFSYSTFPLDPGNFFRDAQIPVVFLGMRNEMFTVFLPVLFDGITLMSCYRTRSSLTYTFYLKPLETSVYILLFVTASFVGRFIQIRSKLGLAERWDVFILSFRTLLGNVDVSGNKITKTKWFSVTISIWLFLTIVLCNAYKGILKSDLAAPKSVTGMDTWDDLHGVDLIAPLKTTW
ncbi:unnamed protein product [Allacma fusca]|uniref:Uncharacterized protein n=1 Tax=Allacma fusca TaxID=39272 RepID=A0A8J2JGD0_9HEXA|nr:unnamed protein product [Allacma fusca]